MLLLRDLTCRNSDADASNLEKSIIRGYIQCKVVITVVIKKTDKEHKKRLTTKEENDVFSPQTVGAGDPPKWSIWSGDPIILGRGPGCTGKFVQTSNVKWRKWYARPWKGCTKIVSTSAQISKYYPSKMLNKIHTRLRQMYSYDYWQKEFHYKLTLVISFFNP